MSKLDMLVAFVAGGTIGWWFTSMTLSLASIAKSLRNR